MRPYLLLIKEYLPEDEISEGMMTNHELIYWLGIDKIGVILSNATLWPAWLLREKLTELAHSYLSGSLVLPLILCLLAIKLKAAP